MHKMANEQQKRQCFIHSKVEALNLDFFKFFAFSLSPKGHFISFHVVSW